MQVLRFPGRLKGKNLILIILGILQIDVLCYAAKNAGGADKKISDGSRIFVKNKGFSIIPPLGWEIHTDYPNMSLLLQIPYKKGLAYQRTIQVMIFKGSRYIDDITSREFEKILIKKYSGMSQSITKYRVRNNLMTVIDDGREGILYYTEFLLEAKKMMQAHVLVSSDKHSYLLTYTDISAHFEGEKASKYLTKAWKSMISIRLAGDPPVRFQKMFLMGLMVIAILILLVLFYLIRHAKASRTYTEHADIQKEGEIEQPGSWGSKSDQPLNSGISQQGSFEHQSMLSSAVSDDEWLFGEDQQMDSALASEKYNRGTADKSLGNSAESGGSGDDGETDDDDPWG